MVDKKHVSKSRRRRSPPPLPPRWGEGVAPPSSPQVSQPPTPVTSPGYHHGDKENRRVIYNAYSYNPRYANQDLLPRMSVSRKSGRRRTQGQSNNIIERNRKVSLIPTQYYKKTHWAIKHQKSPQVSTKLPLSYPSPPLHKHHTAPLTSTLINSPPQLKNYSIHQTSPATPEMSTIPQKVIDATTYQNYEAGIAYLPVNMMDHQISKFLPSTQICSNLSRFHVSPPNNPRHGPSEGTLLNNNKVEHSQAGWIYDQKTRAVVLEPKKVDLVDSNNASTNMRMVFNIFYVMILINYVSVEMAE